MDDPEGQRPRGRELERRILELMREGLSTWQVAERLGLRPSTVQHIVRMALARRLE